MEFAIPADHREKLKENEKKDKYLDLARELKKTVEHVIGALRTVTKGVIQELEDLKIRVIKAGQGTEKSPGDLRFSVLKHQWETIS